MAEVAAKPRRRSGTFELVDRQIAREAEALLALTHLPRAVQIGDAVLPTDACQNRLSTSWGAVFVGFTPGRVGYADYRLASRWRTERTPLGTLQIVDAQDRPRAAILDPGATAQPVLVVLSRFFTTIEGGRDEFARVATIDRTAGAPIRVSPWIAPGEAERLASIRTIHGSWLNEIHPNHADPFAYW